METRELAEDQQTSSGCLKPHLVLASASYCRRQLLSAAGYQFEIIPSHIDEAIQEGESAFDLSYRLASEKAMAVVERIKKEEREAACIVVGSDQVVYLPKQEYILRKPDSYEMAYDQLMRSRGQQLLFYTGLAVYDTPSDTLIVETVRSEIYLKAFDEAIVQAYLEREEPMNAVGGLKFESSGMTLLKSVRTDDPTALMGLPMLRLCDLLEQFGCTVF